MLPILSGAVLAAQSDERLLELSTQGHERAFETLVHRYRKQLIGYCRRRLLDAEQADDVVQQALLSAWKSLGNGSEVHDVKPWLYRIVHNTALNSLRGARYDFEELNDALQGDDAPEADLDRRIAIRQALAGLAALPDMQREALLRTAVEGHSHAQVARDLGVSDTVVRGLVYRARVTLRSAASALTPPPLVAWAASRLAGSNAGMTGQLAQAGLGAGGGGTAGIALLLAKSSAIVVGAGAFTLGAMNVTAPPAKQAVAQVASAAGHGPGGSGAHSGFGTTGRAGHAKLLALARHLLKHGDAAKNNLLLVNLAPQFHASAPTHSPATSNGGGTTSTVTQPSGPSTSGASSSGGGGSTTTPDSSSPSTPSVQNETSTSGPGYKTSTKNTATSTNTTNTTTTSTSTTPTDTTTTPTTSTSTANTSTSSQSTNTQKYSAAPDGTPAGP